MNETLDFSGRTQLYFQLYDIVLEKINSGEYPTGSLLPTENDFMAKYGISRSTVRKAMDMLLNDDLIEKKRGTGTFVKEKKVEQMMQKVLHFSDEMLKQGYEPSTKMIYNETIPAPKHIATQLNVIEGEPLINVYRIRYANDVPISIESAYLVKKLCPSVANHDFSQSSLRKYLIENYNIVWDKAVQQIYAVNANATIAKQLNIPHNDALLYIERVSYTKNQIPGEFLQCYYRSDKYYFTTELKA